MVLAELTKLIIWLLGLSLNKVDLLSSGQKKLPNDLPLESKFHQACNFKNKSHSVDRVVYQAVKITYTFGKNSFVSRKICKTFLTLFWLGGGQICPPLVDFV